MSNLLSAIFYDEPLSLRGKKAFDGPLTAAERQMMSALEALGLEDGLAEELEKKIRALAVESRDRAFLTGARFGARLMLELTEER